MVSVSVPDSMRARSSSSAPSWVIRSADRAIRSIEAGNDVVLTTGHGSWIRVYRALLQKAKSSKAFRTRVRESAARVLALQDSLR